MTLTLTDYVHIVQTGQSLAGGGPIGGSGTNLTTSDPYSGILLTPTGSDTFIDAVEPAPDAYRESGLLATLKSVYEHVGAKKWSMRTDWKGGTAYTGLKKGTLYYNNALAYTTHAKNAAGASSFMVLAVTLAHGEKDMDLGTSQSAYTADLSTWQSDYETDLKAITAQSGTIPMVMMQVTTWPSYTSAPTTGLSMLSIARSAPTKFIMAGPRYHLPYISDGIHLTSESYYDQGEYFAKALMAYYDGAITPPFAPTSIVATSNVVVATFDVPVPPLVFDTTTVASITNKGFSYIDDSGRTISSVAITGASEVTITLSGAAGTNAYLRYGYLLEASGNLAGGVGNLRDSDTYVSARASRPLRNWCCHFNDAVTVSGAPPPAAYPTLYGRLTS